MTASALIVIDMQLGSFTDASLRHDADGLVVRLNSLAARVRRSGGQVIFIRHDGPVGDPHHPTQPGWHLLPALAVHADDRIIAKTACDSFLDTDLGDVLVAHAIDHLIITGCATDYCVDTTVRSALARGYRTTAPSDGHTTADRPHLRAQQIIGHHNAIWADFIAPGGPALVCPCDQITP
ncbi:MAG: cysteine hydrolase [Rhodospirillaceae bacterium]|jgi:nicotinamidase-related amidase|nr:cysteine hydrolase [Rhodospirillaceae bacterium]MBT3495505.1 cysteine hydrolase [Rhodospirillaceae bacterium]MBT3780065.1 cysteine hydrolase [Rhodospirillaceae bacterium]MBT3975452.1 cysteine hydrolase [Rhodospirillaceae bacterium]MBT4170816.1 cysteine hydrolase [Rhodospirillaceae bacterium]